MAAEGGKALLRWSDYDKDRVKQLSTQLMKRSRDTYDRIGSLTPTDVNYENTLKASPMNFGYANPVNLSARPDFIDSCKETFPLRGM